jgi:hypothetical protein
MIADTTQATNISSWLLNYINTNTQPVRIVAHVTELDGVEELKRLGVSVISEDHSRVPISVTGVAPVSVIKSLIGQPYVIMLEGAAKTSTPAKIQPVGVPVSAFAPTGFDLNKFFQDYQYWLIGGTVAVVLGVLVWRMKK